MKWREKCKRSPFENIITIFFSSFYFLFVLFILLSLVFFFQLLLYFTSTFSLFISFIATPNFHNKRIIISVHCARTSSFRSKTSLYTLCYRQLFLIHEENRLDKVESIFFWFLVVLEYVLLNFNVFINLENAANLNWKQYKSININTKYLLIDCVSYHLRIFVWLWQRFLLYFQCSIIHTLPFNSCIIVSLSCSIN